jgi:hypothetical protein
MKTAIRIFALTVVAVGLAAGAYSKTTTPDQVTVAGLGVPPPTCTPGTGGCGIW